MKRIPFNPFSFLLAVAVLSIWVAVVAGMVKAI